MEKTAQIQLSFGVIFSILIIAATLAIAGYMIVKFIGISGNVSCKLFYSDLQKKIDKAWSSDSVSLIFSGNLPKRVEKVCFGSKGQNVNEEDRAAYEEIEFYMRGNNMFYYPREACDDAFNYKLEHANIPEFFCVSADGNKAKVKLNKENFDALVTMAKA